MKYKLLFFVFYFLCAGATPFEKESSYDVCFVPGQKCDENLAVIISEAKSSIYVQAYHLTNKKIIGALIYAHTQGRNVEVILDKSAKKEGNVFKQNGIPVLIDHLRAIAHNKIMIIDGNSIVTGSFNFTESAQKKNVENFIYIKDSTLAKKYYENYENRVLKSVPY